MPLQNVALASFNRGRISPLALARVDLKRVALSAEIQTNFMPRALGSMMLRPGLEYIGASNGNSTAKHLEFFYAVDDTALIELTDEAMRVWIDDELISRGTVGTTISNGTFGSDLSDWTDSDEVGGASAWVTGGYMGLTGNGTAAAIRRQTLTVASGDQNDEHALRIVIERGPVTLRVGSSSGGDEYISETDLDTGEHSLAFTPTGASVYVQFSSRLNRQVLVDSVAIESSGVVELSAPWAEADLSKVRFDQSGDILFVACYGYQQRKIERRATRSWSIVRYAPEDGPFRTLNIGPITLTASAITGNITLTASASLFRSDQVGGLFRLTSSGQRVEQSATAENTFSGSIRITGVDATRIFTIIISGLTSTSSEVTLQRSLEEPGNWEDVSGKTWTANTTETYDDGLDNQIVYYRIGVKTGDYSSGTISLTLSTGIGSITGVVRLTAFSTSTSVSAEVLSDLGGTDATDDWSEGAWSDHRGWPSAVAFHEGRLWWVGKDKFWGSVSDGFNSFDDETEGDAGPISKSIGSGPVDTINWLLGVQRLLAGGQGAEFSARSSSFDEPLTPTNFNIKRASTQGSAGVQAGLIDTRGIFVQRGGTRVFEMLFSVDTYDYASRELTVLVPEIGRPGIVALKVQRQPDTRVHCVRSDGTAAVLVYDPAEEVNCWIDIETDGDIEDVTILPGSEEDAVYYSVKRTIDGNTVRYLEKWAMESECQGDELNKQADSFLVYEGSATSTITGLDHLEGESVVVWADGVCLNDADGEIATFTVSGGSISLTHEGGTITATKAVVGKSYTARFKSAKLAYAAALGTSLGQRQRVSKIALNMAYVHAQGIKYGKDFDHLMSLPQVVGGKVIDRDDVFDSYDHDAITFTGDTAQDSRLCLEANAPRCVTVRAAVLGMATHDNAP